MPQVTIKAETRVNLSRADISALKASKPAALVQTILMYPDKLKTEVETAWDRRKKADAQKAKASPPEQEGQEPDS